MKTLEEKVKDRVRQLFKREAFPSTAWDAKPLMPLCENPGLLAAIEERQRTLPIRSCTMNPSVCQGRGNTTTTETYKNLCLAGDTLVYRETFP